MPRQITEKDFEGLIMEHQALILKICDIYGDQEADKEELFQDIVIHLWKGLSSFKGQSKLSTWIYRVSLNTAISWARKKKKSRLIFPDKMPDRPVKASSEKEDQTRIQALYKGINQLKDIEKAIVLLYLEERSYKEIGEIMGISEKNVSVRLVRLKKKLEKLLKPLMTENA
jgi:RNA polymerase sigma-70 factor (ECF subfamily)